MERSATPVPAAASHFAISGLAFCVALLLGAFNSALAFDYNATTSVTGYSGNLLWNYPDSNTDMYLAPAYNTPQYQALYNALTFAPSAFRDASTVSSAPTAAYGQYTVALRGAGTYVFKVLEPGTIAGQTPTNYDLMSILYVSPTSRTPFNPNSPYANLVGLSDDDNQFEANPFPLFYVNNGATDCVSMTLVFFSWAGVTNSVANIQASGPGSIAASCDALGVSNSIIDLAHSPARGAAAVIDANPALLALFGNLTTDGQKSNAVNQTLPLLTGGSMLAANSALSAINRVVQARIESNRGLSSGDSFDGDKYVWAKPFGSWADQADRGAVSGYKAQTTGLVLGADRGVSERLRLGGALVLADSSITSRSEVAPQSDNVKIYVLVGYGSYSLTETMEVNFQADVGQNRNEATRAIGFASSIASASYTSTTAHAGVGLGKTYRLNDQTEFVPSVRADYTWIKDGGYSENGAGLLNLTVDGHSVEQLILGLDGKAARQLNERTSVSVNLGAGYDTMNKQASITAAFAGAPGASFVTYGIAPSPWLGRGGAGITYMTKAGLEITGRYDAEVREGFRNQTASAKARWAF